MSKEDNHNLFSLKTLSSLRWSVDNLVFLYEYDDYYWLKPCYDENGKRLGITSCCQFNYECNRHLEIRNNKIKNNKPKIN